MKLIDGTLTLHQSDIGHYLTCPEQFRITNGISPGGVWEPPDGGRVETDAATVGTVLHAVIEQDLKQPFQSETDAFKYGRDTLIELVLQYVEDDVEYRTESFGEGDRAVTELRFLVENWMRSETRDYWIRRDRKGYRSEFSFDVPFVDRSDRGRVVTGVRLAGTADIIDIENNRVVDWKSASRAYQRWEKQRWSVQPTVYTYAARELGMIEPDLTGKYRFDFNVFVRGQRYEFQEITVLRGPGQWGWLAQLVNNIADMIESNASTWPLSDDHVLCSPKWCPLWSSCKGAFVEEDWT